MRCLFTLHLTEIFLAEDIEMGDLDQDKTDQDEEDSDPEPREIKQSMLKSIVNFLLVLDSKHSEKNTQKVKYIIKEYLNLSFSTENQFR